MSGRLRTGATTAIRYWSCERIRVA